MWAVFTSTVLVQAHLPILKGHDHSEAGVGWRTGRKLKRRSGCHVLCIGARGISARWNNVKRYGR